MRSMSASALIRLVTALLAVLAIDLLFFRTLNPLLLAGWSILLALSLSYSHRSVLRGDFIERKTVSLTELRGCSCMPCRLRCCGRPR